MLDPDPGLYRIGSILVLIKAPVNLLWSVCRKRASTLPAARRLSEYQGGGGCMRRPSIGGLSSHRHRQNEGDAHFSWRADRRGNAAACTRRLIGSGSHNDLWREHGPAVGPCSKGCSDAGAFGRGHSERADPPKPGQAPLRRRARGGRAHILSAFSREDDRRPTMRAGVQQGPGLVEIRAIRGFSGPGTPIHFLEKYGIATTGAAAVPPAGDRRAGAAGQSQKSTLRNGA
jgi:hypothetical protein